ncbi:hypothetical protein [Pseudonocardia endophytica]|uniref:PemK-like, MazF-like toxin of type II toxin-antitoxin system n=1 Tax=Pseudonocardia endophytica TaxID=401976 RepID=A0A4R1HWN7_PSEEN|nr:hypothetical protein [Pseudonocardia endophytica]TCK24429.1 hypothetical protein EV378_0201 [Pseudonocardia endophytica]
MDLLAWWVVATVGDSVSRPFPAGEKLWVLPPQWGDGRSDTVLVVGRRAGAPANGLIRTVVPRQDLAAFRVGGVYSTDVLDRLTQPITLGWPARMWESRDQAARAAALWNSSAA